MEENDLIAALGTALGEAAISMIRLSGQGAVDLGAAIFRPRKKNLDLRGVYTHTVNLGYICADDGQLLDEVLLCVMRAPRTYTREDVVEIYCHGGVLPAKRVMDLVLDKGARLADPGEFTKRAFLNGRIDLTQAEGVLDLIRAHNSKGADLACQQLTGKAAQEIGVMRDELKGLLAQLEAEIDFPEDVDSVPQKKRLEQIEGLLKRVEIYLQGVSLGRVYREGLKTVLVGKPNVGKSTLLNMLLGEERALVTEIPGTTRDVIEEMIMISGIPLRIVDTAGIRENVGLVEALGINRAREELEKSDLVLAIFDVTSKITAEDLLIFDLIKGKNAIILLNKIDMEQQEINIQKMSDYTKARFPIIEISSKLGWGRQELADAILDVVGVAQVSSESVLLTRKRHQIAMEKVKDRLNSAASAIVGELPPEFIAVDLWDTWSALGEITGDTLSAEIIETIFSDFCIGK